MEANEPEIEFVHEAPSEPEPEVTAAVVETKEPPTPVEVLQSAPTVHEVLARPDAYAAWYNGARKEALNG